MRPLFYKLPQNIVKIFSGYNLLWHLLAIALTYIMVVSGFDWQWFTLFNHGTPYSFFFIGAGLLGFIVPVFVPLIILLKGKIGKNARVVNTAWALGQAAILGLLISWFYKAFTGRPGPEIMANAPLVDISNIFQFGVLRGGIFWGWPSSHTMVAFATAVTLATLYPKNRKVKWLGLLYACYIGFGASIGFHWLSDCIAGAIMGTVIGVVVGRNFLNKLMYTKPNV